MSEFLPSDYLTHDTPAGPRFAYPRPQLEDYPSHWQDKPAVTWATPDESWVTIVEVGSWLVADTPVRVVTASWLPPTRPGPWRKTTDPPLDPYARPAWDAAPEVPPAEEVEHHDTHLVETCLRCELFRVLHDRPRVQSPPETRTVDFTSWVPLPGAPDPDPDKQWVLNDSSAVAVYGAHTAHLWPGYLPGFRDRVYELLQADPRVQYVFDAKNHRDQTPGSLQTTVPIRWDTPKTSIRSRTGARGQKLRGREEIPQPIAHSARTTLVVPTGVSGATKAEALARWDSEIARYVGLLVPVDVVTCNRCDGHGHLLARDVEEET
jgi:hypothetical protein